MRYLANSNTHEIHDMINVTDACNLKGIRRRNQVAVDSYEEACRLVLEEGYNGCSLCLPELDADRSFASP